MIFALHASFMPELFGTKVRYSGISLGFQVGGAIGGGLMPLFAAAIAGWSNGATWPISLLLILFSITTTTAIICAKEKVNKSIEA